MPREYRSLRGSGWAPWACSGLKYDRRAHHRTGLGQVRLGGRVHGPGDAEVGDLHLAVRSDQDVGRLDVAVGEPGLVGEAERSGDLARDLGSLLGGELLVRLEDLGEGAALHVLHGDEVGAFVAAPVVDVDDVGMAEVGGRLGFAAEPFDEVRVDARTRGTGS